MNRFATVLSWLTTVMPFLSETLQKEASELIAFIENNGKIIFKRKLVKLKFVKTIIVPAFNTTREKFFVQGENQHKLIVWMSAQFENEILPHIPASLNFAGGKVDSFELTQDMWDSAITNELGNPVIISIKECAERTTSIIVNNSSDLKTNGCSNIQYVKASDGRVVVVSAVFAGDEWHFRCYELNEISHWNTGPRVLDSAMVASD